MAGVWRSASAMAAKGACSCSRSATTRAIVLFYSRRRKGGNLSKKGGGTPGSSLPVGIQNLPVFLLQIGAGTGNVLIAFIGAVKLDMDGGNALMAQRRGNMADIATDLLDFDALIDLPGAGGRNALLLPQRSKRIAALIPQKQHSISPLILF